MKKIIFALVLLSAVPVAGLAQNNPISIELPSKRINGTKLKMKAELFAMLYNQSGKYLSLNWRVSYYADSSGHYGPKIELPGIASYSKESIADNRTKVNAESGEIIEPDSTGAYPSGINLIGQYDFFFGLAETQNINVHDLIRAYGAAVKEW